MNLKFYFKKKFFNFFNASTKSQIGFKNITASDIFFPTKVNFFKSNNPNKICDIDLTQFNDDLNRYTTTKRSTLLKFLLKNQKIDFVFSTT